jgi:hypothetical protein
VAAPTPDPTIVDRMDEGRAIVVASWVSNVVLAVAVLPPVVGLHSFEGVSVAVSMISFLVSMVVWVWALVLAALRTTRGDDVQVGSLFLFQGAVAGTPRRSLYLSFAVCLVITVIAAASDPFVVLAPMLPLGFVGLWGARHGVYPARRETTPAGRTRAPGSTSVAPPAPEPDEEG